MSDLFAVPATPNLVTRSINEERREVLESVWGVLARERADPEELAACSYLLAQLSRGIGVER